MSNSATEMANQIDRTAPTPVEILLVEDNPADIELTRIAFQNARIINNLNIVKDGQEALDYLFKRPPFESVNTPDVILLDINLPQIDGIQVLETLKRDPRHEALPVIMLTSSSAERDIVSSYTNNAHSYITKPVSFDKFMEEMQKIEGFCLSIVKFPPAV